MNSHSSSDERQLHSLLASLQQQYRQTLTALQGLQHRFGPGNDPLTVSAELRQALQTIQANQPVYRAAIEFWNSSRQPPSAATQQLVQDVKSTLGELLDCISQLEQEAAASRTKLLPQLDEAVRRQQACHAYQQGSADYVDSE